MKKISWSNIDNIVGIKQIFLYLPEKIRVTTEFF